MRKTRISHVGAVLLVLMVTLAGCKKAEPVGPVTTTRQPTDKQAVSSGSSVDQKAPAEPVPVPLKPIVESRPDVVTGLPADVETVTDTMDEEEYLVARVDGTDISASRQFKRVSSALGHTTGSDGTARFSRAAVDGLVEDFLVTRGLDKLSPPVTETDVAVALGMSEQKLQAERRRNPARIEAKLRHLSETRLMEQAGLLKVPTEDEMRAEFARRRTTRLIVVEVPVRRNVDEAQVDKQRKRAELLATAVKGGKGLGNAAAEIEGLGPRAQRARPLVLRDGDTRHLKLAQAAALLGEGETGGPVRTRKGWAVFKVVKKVEPQFEYTEVRDRLKNKLQERQRPGARRQYLRQLRKAATIEYLVEFPK